MAKRTDLSGSLSGLAIVTSEPQSDNSDATEKHRSTSISRLFALIIGINTYDDSQHFFSLRYAREDALRFKAYLMESLLVPESHITVLLDKEASRERILGSLEGLAHDDRILMGDPLLVFFAGHGTEMKDGVVDGEKGTIQMLVPADYAAIPDFIIGRVLDYIADKKGDNITVILDCCNSASGTRGSTVVIDPSAPLTRAIHPDHVNYKKDLDKALLQRIRRGTKDELGRRVAKSHMLLAACQSSEEAKEKDGSGVFSSALLNLFKTKPPTILRYCDILDHMDVISGQNPQCQGPFQNRMLFDGKCESRSIKSKFKVEIGPSLSNITIHAGSAHGITNGAVFEVYDSVDASFTQPLGKATVQTSITAFSSPAILDPGHSVDSDNSKRLVAIQVRAGQKEALRLYVPPRDRFRKIYSDVIKSQLGRDHELSCIVLTDHKDATTKLQATMNANNEVVFELCDEAVTKYGFARCFPPVPTGDGRKVAWILNRIAHYFAELNRRNVKAQLAEAVTVEFYKLEERDDDGEMEKIEPNLCKNNIIDFVVEDGCPYGLKLVNNSPQDLYPYVFIFESQSLCIDEYFSGQRPVNNKYKVEPTLKARSEITLGFGPNVTVQPRMYTFEDGQDIDVTFLKVFLTTMPLDLNHIGQKSPFEDIRAAQPYKPRQKDKWDAITIPIVQRRATRAE